MSTSSDVVYVANLDGDQILKELQKLNNSFANAEKKGNEAFGGIQTKASKSGVSMGIVEGVVKSLVEKFIELGAKAASALFEITKNAVELNKEAELTRISLTQIFGGNEKAAEAFLQKVNESAVKLGVSRQELGSLAKGILPDVGNAQGTLDLIEQITILGKDAGASFTSIRIAIEEALSGNLSSLQRRLNIPKNVLDDAEKLGEKIGVAAGLSQALQERIDKTGLSLEATADSLATLGGRLQGELSNLQVIFGESAFEELKEQAESFLNLFEENKDDIEAVAKAFGDFAANVIEVVGSNIGNFLENVDTEGVENFADTLSDGVASLDLLVNTLLDPNLFNNAIEGATKVVDLLGKAAVTASQIGALAKADRARDKAEAAALESSLESVLGEVDTDAALLPGITAKLGRLFADSDTKARAAAEGQKAYEESLRASLNPFEEHTQAQARNAEQTENRRKKTVAATEADLAAGDAVLTRQRELDELARLEGEATDAQAKIDEKRAKEAEQSERRRTEILVDQERERLDIIEKNGQKRLDIETKNQRKVDDILKSDGRRREDLARDLTQEEADIVRDGGRKRAEIERDTAKERVDAQKNYLEEIRRIQQSFEQSAAEAERTNDAKRFLELQRQRDNQLGEAERQRDENISEAGEEANERRQELKRELALEVEDAKRTADEKLAVLQTRLNRELEDQRLARERDLEDQTLAEVRREEQRLLANQRELDDFRQTQALKKQDLEKSLAEELAIVAEFEKKKADITIAEAQRAAEEAQKARELALKKVNEKPGKQQRSDVPLVALTGDTSKQLGGSKNPLYLPGFQHGGEFMVGGSGGPDSQLIRFLASPGERVTINPPGGNQTLFRPPIAPSSVPSINQSSMTNNNAFHLAESMFNDPIARQQLEAFILSVQAKYGRR